MMKGPDTHHVVPNPDGGWDVKRGGATRASSHHETKAKAVDHAHGGCRAGNAPSCASTTRTVGSRTATATATTPSRRVAEL